VITFHTVDLSTSEYQFSPQHIVEHQGNIKVTIKNDYSHHGIEEKTFNMIVKPDCLRHILPLQDDQPEI
jgi:hypothetical protein